MSSYVVEFTASAQKELNKLPKSTSARIAKAIYMLKDDPRKGSVRPMVGTKSWRLRVGDYRIIYDISDNKLIVLIIRIRHRRDVYKH